MNIDFEYIDNDKELVRICDELGTKHVIGVDLECENNLHHFGSRLALIQVSDGVKHYLVDVLAIKDLKPFFLILSNNNIVKIFHDVDFDFRILLHEFGARVHNVFDSQLAATLLGRTELGLGSLLEEFFKVAKEKKFQMADWLKRPLDDDMLEYAIKDTVYLVKLREFLLKEAEEKGRTHWIEQECAFLEEKDYIYHEQEYIDVRGVKVLSETERAIFKRLFLARQKVAKKVDRPVHFIISSKRLIEFCQKPLSLKQWKDLKAVHPAVRKFAQLFFDATEKGKTERDVYVRGKHKKFSPKQKTFIQSLTLKRDDVADKLNVPRHLIMSKEQIKDVAINGNYNSLRPWQKNLIES